MSTSSRRAALGGLAVAAALGVTAMTASPALAGGPGTIYIYGSTQSSCEVNLSNAIHSQQRHHEISGVHHCRKTGDGLRWFGDFVIS